MHGIDPRALGDVLVADPDDPSGFYGMPLDTSFEERMLISAVQTQDVLCFPANVSAPDSTSSVVKASLVPWLRARGFTGLAGELDTTQNTVDLPTQAPPAAISPAAPDPERRLAKLTELGGTYKYRNGKWSFTGIGKLENSERNADHKRCSQKTIRDDLIEAAQSERELKQAGALQGGLGQR